MKTFIRSLLFIQIFLLLYANNLNAQTFTWAKSFTNPYCNGSSISVDLNGNSYITGTFNGTAIFDTIQLSGYGIQDIFIA
jgi:hypothetical protein